jgi:hypothetical protein
VAESVEARPSIAHFLEVGWGRNGLVVVGIIVALVLSVLRSPLSILVLAGVVISETLLVATFVRARLAAGPRGLEYTGVVGGSRRFAIEELSRVEVNRPTVGLVGRPRRIVFLNRADRAMLALDPSVWDPDDLARVASVLGLPIDRSPDTQRRSAGGHASRLLVAAIGLAGIIGTIVAAAVLIAYR